MTYEIAGRRALVTGASSGIGAGLAVALAEAGATVGLAARRTERLRSVLDACQAHSPASRMWTVDLADPAAVDRLAGDALAELGGVDLLVNCAGIPKRRHVTELDAATVEAVMQVNFLAAARLTLALLPSMLERNEGRIVNVASVAATLSSPNESAYDASKAALAVFSEAMAVDLWETGIKVMVVYPGVVDTELFQLPDNDPAPDAVEPITVEEAVGTILEGLRSEVFQVYVPEWFAKLASDKAAHVEAFLEGTAAFMRGERGTGRRR